MPATDTVPLWATRIVCGGAHVCETSNVKNLKSEKLKFQSSKGKSRWAKIEKTNGAAMSRPLLDPPDDVLSRSRPSSAEPSRFQPSRARCGSSSWFQCQSCTSSFFILRVELLVAAAESGAHRAPRTIVLSSAPLSSGVHGGGWPVRAELGRLVDCNRYLVCFAVTSSYTP